MTRLVSANAVGFECGPHRFIPDGAGGIDVPDELMVDVEPVARALGYLRPETKKLALPEVDTRKMALPTMTKAKD